MSIPKKGDIIEFNFHGFGLVSQEDAEVTEVTDKYVEIDDEYKFDLKTGKCLNDNTHMSCYRTLPKKHLK